MWWPGKCFLMLFGCPRQNINHSPDNLKVIYIRPFVFYARISHQFMTSELENVEKLVEQQPSKLKFLFSGHLATNSLGLVARGNF